MKRSISALVIIAMLLASVLAIIPVSAAPEAKAIKNADDFANMAYDGNYYLDADIEIEASVEAFKGTLDGKDFTITLEGDASSVFDVIDGANIKNLTIEGSVFSYAVGSKHGALTKELKATAREAVIENVTSNVSLTIKDEGDDPQTPFTGVGVGGLVGYATGAFTMKNCTNNGAIKVQTQAKIYDGTHNRGEANGWFGLGGLVGTVETKATVVLDNCKNAGALSSVQVKSQIGGMIGEVKFAKATVRSCINEGTLTLTIAAPDAQYNDYSSIGGMVGAIRYTNDSKGEGYLQVINSTNAKKAIIKNDDKNKASSNVYAGGILGRGLTPVNVIIAGCTNLANIIHDASGGWGGAGGIVSTFMVLNVGWDGTKMGNQKIVNCVNEGNITASNQAGGILGFTVELNTEDEKLVIESCKNTGAVSAPNAGGIIGNMSAGNMVEKFSDVTVKNCHNTGAITASGDHAGGIVGYVGAMGTKNKFTIDGCFMRLF